MILYTRSNPKNPVMTFLRIDSVQETKVKDVYVAGAFIHVMSPVQRLDGRERFGSPFSFWPKPWTIENGFAR